MQYRVYLLTREKPRGHKESDTSERTCTQRQYYRYSSKYFKGSLPFIFIYTNYMIQLRTRIQYFSDLIRKYDNMCLSAHGCYIFFIRIKLFTYWCLWFQFVFYAVTYLHVHISLSLSLSLYIYMYMHTHIYIYTCMVEFFPLRYRVWEDILNSTNLK